MQWRLTKRRTARRLRRVRDHRRFSRPAEVETLRSSTFLSAAAAANFKCYLLLSILSLSFSLSLMDLFDFIQYRKRIIFVDVRQTLNAVLFKGLGEMSSCRAACFASRGHQPMQQHERDSAVRHVHRTGTIQHCRFSFSSKH